MFNYKLTFLLNKPLCNIGLNNLKSNLLTKYLN